MKRLAFLSSVAISVSTAAHAQPVTSDLDRPDEAAAAGQEHGFFGDYIYLATTTGADLSPEARDVRGGWIPVARDLSATTSRQSLEGPAGEGFRRLRIESDLGAPLVQQVVVNYVDGTSQKIRVYARLPRGLEQEVDIDRGAICKIVVHTDPAFGGAYSVYAT